jgi:hypothetical protein
LPDTKSKLVLLPLLLIPQVIAKPVIVASAELSKPQRNSLIRMPNSQPKQFMKVDSDSWPALSRHSNFIKHP